MNYIRSKKLIWKLKCTPEMLRYDKVIMSALCHQLGLIQQLHHVHENVGLDPHLRTVMDVVFNMRNHLAEIRQKINQNNDVDNNIAKFDRVMKNLSLLLSLEPSLSDYTQKSQIEQQQIELLKKQQNSWYDLGNELYKVTAELPKVKGRKDKRNIKNTRFYILNKAKECFEQAYQLGHPHAAIMRTKVQQDMDKL